MRTVLGFPLDTNLIIDINDAESGKLIRQTKVHNLVTNSGLNLVRDLMANTGRAPNTIAIGTGTSPTTATMTTLQTEVYRYYFSRRVTSTASIRYQLYLDASTPSTQPYTIGEAGIFSGGSYYGSSAPSSGGTLFARATFSPFLKDSSITVTFTWDCPVTAG
jgi:hypothetical protein